MAIQADLSMLSAHERRFFLREVLGILEAIAAILILLSLISASRGEQWVGALGGGAAGGLEFLLGRYVAYFVPVMLAAMASSALLGTPREGSVRRSWVRGGGGMLLLVSACAVLALHLGGAIGENPEAVFTAGGLIGSFLSDSDGLDLTGALGRPGSFVALYGLAILGSVLFTQTLVRDMGRLSWKLWRNLLPGRWLGIVAWPGRWVARGVKRLRLKAIAPAVGRFFDTIQFTRATRGRVFEPAPISEIRRAGERTTAGGARHGKAPKQAKSRRGRGRSRDSDRVFGGRGRDSGPMLQPELELFPTAYELPSLDILADPPATNYRMSEREASELSGKIEETLGQFRIEVEVTDVVQGPVVTRFALKIIGKGVRVSKIQSLENDIALALKAQHVRILTPIPGQAAVGIEVPNKRRNPVMLKELMESRELARSKAPLSFVLGKNISGEPVIVDLVQMPHVLIAGATGAGKSVCLNTIIASILFRNPPDRVKFVMIDPKRVELSIYQGIPHLLAPVVSEPRKAASALSWTVEQMEERYRLLAEVGVRNIDGYNALVESREPHAKTLGRDLKFLPKIVVVIDELADLMMVAKNEVEEYVIRLAQMARAVGIHLVVATQRPSVNVITGIIKANFPTRIAFRVSSKVDSRTILDMNGAEALLGRGDMLYSPGGVKPFRIQGAFVSDAEVELLADTIRAQERAHYEKDDFETMPTPAQRAKAQLMREIGGSEKGEPEGGGEEEGRADRRGAPRPPTRGRANAKPLPPASMDNLTDEDLYDIALRLVLESRKASVSYIQRRLRIGYARAGRVMDMMEERGIVGPYKGSRPRDIIVDPGEYMTGDEEEEQ